MSVFNPMILDASIQTITSALRDEEKAEVLLFAAKHLDLARYVPCNPPAHPLLHTTLRCKRPVALGRLIDPAQVAHHRRERGPVLPPDPEPGANLCGPGAYAPRPGPVGGGHPARDTSRCAGLRRAHQWPEMLAYLSPVPIVRTELQAILTLDPDHVEAKTLLFPQGLGVEQKVQRFRRSYGHPSLVLIFANIAGWHQART
jgi:hypothetical protein